MKFSLESNDYKSKKWYRVSKISQKDKNREIDIFFIMIVDGFSQWSLGAWATRGTLLSLRGYRIARSTIYHRHFSPESKHGFHLVADNILKTAIVEIVVVIEDCRRPKLIG